jgi:hypothetical protein
MSRPRSYRPTLDDLRAIDVRDYAREGYLAAGRSGTTRWSQGDRETGVIGFEMEDGKFVLRYRVRIRGAAWEDRTEQISLEFSPQFFGGRRVWFLCPGCSRRCAKLHGLDRFRCRLCWGLPYKSQGEQPLFRKLRRAQQLREKLGGSGNMTLPFPEKPKGMHQNKYGRLAVEGARLERAVFLSLSARRSVG